jgi:hypothetical protein
MLAMVHCTSHATTRKNKKQPQLAVWLKRAGPGTTRRLFWPNLRKSFAYANSSARSKANSTRTWYSPGITAYECPCRYRYTNTQEMLWLPRSLVKCNAFVLVLAKNCSKSVCV